MEDVTTPTGIRILRNRGQENFLNFFVFSASHRQKNLDTLLFCMLLSWCNHKKAENIHQLGYFRKKKQAKLNKRNIDFCSSPTKRQEVSHPHRNHQLSIRYWHFSCYQYGLSGLIIPDVRNIVDEVLQCWVKRWGGLKKDLVQECYHKWEGAGSNTDILWNLELHCIM